MEQSLPAGRNEGALVVLADGVELPEDAGQARQHLSQVLAQRDLLVTGVQ